MSLKLINLCLSVWLRFVGRACLAFGAVSRETILQSSVSPLFWFWRQSLVQSEAFFACLRASTATCTMYPVRNETFLAFSWYLPEHSQNDPWKGFLRLIIHNLMKYASKVFFLPLLHNLTYLPKTSSFVVAARPNSNTFTNTPRTNTRNLRTFASKMATAVDHTDKSGAFKRKQSKHRSIISKENKEYPPESGRYHLHIALACPW